MKNVVWTLKKATRIDFPSDIKNCFKEIMFHLFFFMDRGLSEVERRILDRQMSQWKM